MNSEKQLDCVNELTAMAQSYRKKHPNNENGYQMEALVYKQFGMLDKQKEILKQAIDNPIATPRCAIMLADIEFREQKYDQSLKNFQLALAESNKMKTDVHDGYLYIMSALCKIASAKQKNVSLKQEDVLDIYKDFDIALSYADNLNSNYKDVLTKKTTYLLDKYNVSVPENNKQLRALVKDIKKTEL